jgi:hypothetical protein
VELSWLLLLTTGRRFNTGMKRNTFQLILEWISLKYSFIIFIVYKETTELKVTTKDMG